MVTRNDARQGSNSGGCGSEGSLVRVALVLVEDLFDLLIHGDRQHPLLHLFVLRILKKEKAYSSSLHEIVFLNHTERYGFSGRGISIGMSVSWKSVLSSISSEPSSIA